MIENQTSSDSVIRLKTERISRWLMIVVACVSVAGVVLALIDQNESPGLVGEVLSSLHRLFNPDLEANLATWFATGLLLGGALTTALVAKTKWDREDPLRYHWSGLSLVVLFMSIDEAAQIHEMLIKPTQELLGVSGATGWVWIVPVLVVVAVLAVASIRLVKAQSVRTRRTMVLAFGLFLLGAVAIETVGSLLFGSERGLGFELAAAVEEFFEMSGAVVYLHAMLGLLASLQVKVAFEEAGRSALRGKT